MFHPHISLSYTNCIVFCMFFCCFHIVAQRGYVDVARVLLESSADVNFQSSSGKTALMMACYSGKWHQMSFSWHDSFSLLLGLKEGLISSPWFSQRIKGLFCHEKLCFVNLYKFFSNKPAALLTIEVILLLWKIKLCSVRNLVTLSFTIKVQGKIHQNFLFEEFKETKLRDSSWCLKAKEPQKYLCYLLCQIML